MTEKSKSRSELGARLRETRLFLGYETAASFARAIGYPPAKIGRYERVGMQCSGKLLALVKAIDEAGFGELSLEWLLGFGPIWRSRPQNEEDKLRAKIRNQPAWKKPLLTRFAIQTTNGMPVGRAIYQFEQACILQQMRGAAREVGTEGDVVRAAFDREVEP